MATATSTPAVHAPEILGNDMLNNDMRIPPHSTSLAVSGSTVVQAPPPALALQQAPQLVLEDAHRAARAIQQVIEAKPKKLVLNGKTYLEFEDWQTLGRFYGVTAIARSTEYVEYGERKIVRGFEAKADALLVSTNQVISSAEAMCLDDEPKWGMRPKYEWQNNQRRQVGEEPVPMFQLRSMAQTRACAKALRNVLAWVVVLAGYAPTPAEEMDGKVIARPAAPRSCATPMSAQRVSQLCNEIATAATLDQLKARYLAAGNAAKQADDREALGAFIAAKDARKKALA